MAKCSSCGKEVPLTWTVCPYCGAKMSHEGGASWERVSPEKLGDIEPVWVKGQAAPGWLLATIKALKTIVKDRSAQAYFINELGIALMHRGLIRGEDFQYFVDYLSEIVETRGF